VRPRPFSFVRSTRMLVLQAPTRGSRLLTATHAWVGDSTPRLRNGYRWSPGSTSASALSVSAAIGYDIVVGGRRQPMGVMNLVFPITALYFGPAALALYWRWGRVGARSPRPRWATMAIEVSHCGSGCTLGDLISEWVIYAFALAVAGHVLFAEYIGASGARSRGLNQRDVQEDRMSGSDDRQDHPDQMSAKTE
jgi:hypothetical protein